MIQTTMLSSKMQQLQKQYGKDKERYNLELQKLYQREKVPHIKLRPWLPQGEAAQRAGEGPLRSCIHK